MVRFGWFAVLSGLVLVASTLAPAMPLQQWFDPEPTAYRLEVDKRQRVMHLWREDHLLRSFRIALGKQPNGSKQHRGDGRTPVGRYYIGDKRPSRRFKKFLALTYPNVSDAERALQQNLIDQELWADILFATLERALPPQNTPLGGGVGIHGYGGREELPIDWTEGCIAVSDSEIDYLYEIVPVGTPVDIREE
ncbi:MAG: L,D-transpeptidase [Candidatus Binatia bacterium]|nr:L,D-transpeptidase [Candidatus Binatia bacterium]